jgi:molecular chaperone DnaK
MAYSLGIDLGTTYSAAAVARGDRLEIFQLGERAATIPSIVLLRADGEVLTGEAAERRALAEPTRTGREFKRRLGDPTPIILGGTPYGAEALLAHLLRAIVDRVSSSSASPRRRSRCATRRPTARTSSICCSRPFARRTSAR